MSIWAFFRLLSLETFPWIFLLLWLSACSQPPPSATSFSPVPATNPRPTDSPFPYPLASLYPATSPISPGFTSPYPLPITTPYSLPASPYPPPATLPPIPPTNITAILTATIQTLPHPLSTGPYSPSFTDPQHGWIADGPSIYTTSDGGVNWNWLTELPATVGKLVFTSQQDGWALSPAGLFHTTDGGLSWQTVILPSSVITSTSQIKDIDFSTAQRGWIVLKDQFLSTNDIGKTWQVGSLPCAGVLARYQDWHHRSLHLLGETEAWLICGGDPAGIMHMAYKWLFYSLDNGKSWELITSVTPENVFGPGSIFAIGYWPDLFFLDNYLGWVTTDSSILFTKNGGFTWVPVRTPGFDGTFSAPKFFSANLGTMNWSRGGEDFTLKTLDGGQSWQSIFPPPLPRKIQFLDAQNGIGIGTDSFTNLVFETHDGGHTWNRIGSIGKLSWQYPAWPPNDQECTSYILAVDFVTIRTGWAVAKGCDAEPNFLFTTQDGGKTWERRGSLPRLSDVSLSVVDPQNGFLFAGNSDLLYTTSDGGQTFQFHYELSSPLLKYQSFQFISLAEGAKLVDGKLFLTTYGGVTWKGILRDHLITDYVLLPGGQVWVLSTKCSNTTHTVGTCLYYLLNSQDYGLSWRRYNLIGLPLENNPFFTSITFADSQYGWLRTEDHLYATTNGGSTWNMVR